MAEMRQVTVGDQPRSETPQQSKDAGRMLTKDYSADLQYRNTSVNNSTGRAVQRYDRQMRRS
jgi:hypothetical protein